MLFMIIERFRGQDARAVYERLHARGRSLPEGLSFVSSYVEASCERCWQVVDTDDVTLVQRWIAEWRDLVSFEVVPVASGTDTAAAIGQPLAGS